MEQTSKSNSKHGKHELLHAKHGCSHGAATVVSLMLHTPAEKGTGAGAVSDIPPLCDWWEDTAAPESTPPKATADLRDNPLATLDYKATAALPDSPPATLEEKVHVLVRMGKAGKAKNSPGYA